MNLVKATETPSYDRLTVMNRLLSNSWRKIRYPLFSVLSLAMVLTIGFALVAQPAHARRARKGLLKVSSTVNGAEVFIDGRSIGQTPIKAKALRTGRYRLLVKKTGYLEFSERIRIKKGKTTKITADLLPFAGVIVVNSDIPGATVFVDGKKVGKTPLTYEVVPGRHTVLVRAKGHKTFKRKFRATPGEEEKIGAWFVNEAPADDLAMLPLDLPPLDGGGGLPALPDVPADDGLDALALELPPADDDPLALAAPPADDDPLALAAPPVDDLGLEGLPGLELPSDDVPGGGDLVAIDALPLELSDDVDSPQLAMEVDGPPPWWVEGWLLSAVGATVVTVAAVGIAAATGGGEQETIAQSSWALQDDFSQHQQVAYGDPPPGWYTSPLMFVAGAAATAAATTGYMAYQKHFASGAGEGSAGATDATTDLGVVAEPVAEPAPSMDLPLTLPEADVEPAPSMDLPLMLPEADAEPEPKKEEVKKEKKKKKSKRSRKSRKSKKSKKKKVEPTPGFDMDLPLEL